MRRAPHERRVERVELLDCTIAALLLEMEAAEERWRRAGEAILDRISPSDDLAVEIRRVLDAIGPH